MGQMSAPRLQALFGQDLRRAADWVRVAAAEGLPQAQVCYGRMLLEGTGVEKDAAQALKWFQRAAATGDIDAVDFDNEDDMKTSIMVGFGSLSRLSSTLSILEIFDSSAM